MSARVARVEPAAFTKIWALGVDEQRVYIVLDITSPREDWKRLGDAFRIEARIELARIPGVVIVPVGALFKQQSEWSVFVIENKRAHIRRLAIADHSETNAVVQSGLVAGERVVVFPPPALHDGALGRAPRRGGLMRDDSVTKGYLSIEIEDDLSVSE